jgi:hypothetical protein
VGQVFQKPVFLFGESPAGTRRGYGARKPAKESASGKHDSRARLQVLPSYNNRGPESARDMLNKIHGSHSFKFGADFSLVIQPTPLP